MKKLCIECYKKEMEGKYISDILEVMREKCVCEKFLENKHIVTEKHHWYIILT